MGLALSLYGSALMELSHSEMGHRRQESANRVERCTTVQTVHVRKRDIRAGMRLAVGQMIIGVSRMKGLTFTIDPTARWSARDGEAPAVLNLLPLCWLPHPTARSHPESFHAPARTGNRATCPRHATFPVMRNLLQARLSCASDAIRRTNHSSYESYCISTTQNGNGMWVAAFGRHEGEFDAAGRAKLTVLETAPEVAEVIAIADAQITIDDRLTGKTG